MQTEDRQPQHCQTYSTCAHSEKSVPEANIGWALAKERSGSTQFSEKEKDYLTKKFDLGEKTGQKPLAGQVAKEMRNVRIHDNQRRFRTSSQYTLAEKCFPRNVMYILLMSD